MRDEEAAPLWDAYFADPSQENRNRIVEYYYGLVRLAATPMIHRAPEWQPVDDLLGYGAVGLIQAVERFDPEQGVTFATFATRRIQGAIMDGQRVEDPLTRTARRKLQRAYSAMSCDTTETMTKDDLVAGASEAEMSRGEVTHLIAFAQQAHYEAGTAEEDGWDEAGNWLTSQDETETAVEVLAFADVISSGLARLSDQERTFVAYHYGEDLGLRALQEVLGVSDARLARVRLNIVRALAYV